MGVNKMIVFSFIFGSLFSKIGQTFTFKKFYSQSFSFLFVFLFFPSLSFAQELSYFFEDDPVLDRFSVYGSESVLPQELTASLPLAEALPSPQAIEFNNDGTKLFVAHESTDHAVSEYVLSIPYDLSSGTFSTSLSDNVAPNLMAFSSDGTRLFLGALSIDRLIVFREFTLDNAFDISTAVFTASHTVPTDINLRDSFRAATFVDDGSKLFLAKSTVSEEPSIIAYSMSTEYDLSTATIENSWVVPGSTASSSFSSLSDFSFSPDGDELYAYIQGGGPGLLNFKLSTPYDLSSAIASENSIFFPGYEPGAIEIVFNDSGVSLYSFDFRFASIFSGIIYQYLISRPGDYVESVANDGSVSNETPIVVTLSGDTFQDSDSDDLLDVGSEVFINNIPSGLTPVFSLSAGDTIATLTLMGKANNHLLRDSVSDITFSFTDLAFSSALAADVLSSGATAAHSSNVGVNFENSYLIYSGEHSNELKEFISLVDNAETRLSSLSSLVITFEVWHLMMMAAKSF